MNLLIRKRFNYCQGESSTSFDFWCHRCHKLNSSFWLIHVKILISRNLIILTTITQWKHDKGWTGQSPWVPVQIKPTWTLLQLHGKRAFDTKCTFSIPFCFLFSGLLSLATCQSQTNSKYNLHNMPQTSFTCRDKILGGYYADAETNCQMFHICVKVAGVGVSWKCHDDEMLWRCLDTKEDAILYHVMLEMSAADSFAPQSFPFS